MHHLPDVVLIVVDSLRVCNIVNNIALGTARQIDGLDPKRCVRRTLRGATHVIKSVVHGELSVIIRLDILFEVVRVDMLPVQEAKNRFEGLLSASHVLFYVSFSG